jgi:hypothetical protein
VIEEAPWYLILSASIVGFLLGLGCAYFRKDIANGFYKGFAFGVIFSIVSTFLFSTYGYWSSSIIYFIMSFISGSTLSFTISSRSGTFTTAGFVISYPITYFGLWKGGLFVSLDALPWQFFATYAICVAFALGLLVKLINRVLSSINRSRL